ncbi:MAG: peptidoglycan-binding protein LysM, partial [Bradyrhizobium sp.]|nr:peptidoglycan-binding protein LysM [Bradyrhizobium sp.]
NYRVPLWALQQSNRGIATTPLIPGQRIILPRHLLPQAANQPAAAVSPEAPVRR